MSRAAYMNVVGDLQERIQGDISDERFAPASIKVFKLTHCLERPWEGQGSLLKSSISHLPLEVLKPVDRASPLLHQALCNKECLEVTITWFHPDSEGKLQPYYRLLLEGAQIQAITTEMPDCRLPEKDNWHLYESIRLIYQKITWQQGAGPEQEFTTLARSGGQ